jgi:hypothetical protein
MKFINFFKKFYFAITIGILFWRARTVAAAYDFMQNSGLSQTAEKTGHTSQKLFGADGSLESGIATVLTMVLSLLGAIFLILMLYGGVSWMTANGNDQRVDRAQTIIVDAIIGLFLVVLAYAFSYLLLGQLMTQVFTF